MAPKAEILPIKVLSGASGSGVWDDIIDGLEYLKTWRHPETNRSVSVVSMSLSADSRGISSSKIDRLHKAIKDLTGMDIAIFCSMGNTGGDSIRYPASLPEVIAVGAVDIKQKKAYFTTTGDHVDICSIGVDVLSAAHTGGYCKMSGTSMSTPMSAGNALEIANKYRETFGKRIKESLLYDLVKFNTKDLGIKGVDKIHGAGFFTLQPLEADLWMMHGDKNIVINDDVIEMETPAEIKAGRFLVPLRYISEATGAYVAWDPEQRTANVRY
jgi:major intracellular serine protease